MNSEEENIYLKKKLSSASAWMQQQVRESQKEVILQKSDKHVNDFYHTNIEDIISEKIYSFFPQSVMMYFPDNAIKNIVSSELIYYHIMQG